MAEGKMVLIIQIKEQNINWQLLKILKWKWRQREFPAYSFRFMLLKLCKIHSEIVLLHFFGRSGFFSICGVFRTRAVLTGSLSATKNVSERHVSSKGEHSLKTELDWLFSSRIKVSAICVERANFLSVFLTLVKGWNN